MYLTIKGWVRGMDKVRPRFVLCPVRASLISLKLLSLKMFRHLSTIPNFTQGVPCVIESHGILH